MKVYYDGQYKIKDSSGKERIYEKLEDIPKYNIIITEIKIKEGTTKINDKAFRNCKHLKKVIMPDSITEIGIEAFWNCSSLKEINLPKNIKKINRCAFAYCKSLESIILPNHLEKIDEKAFLWCCKLEKIYIPEKTIICPSAFENSSLMNEEGINKIKKRLIKNTNEYYTDLVVSACNLDMENHEMAQEVLSINPIFYDCALPIDREIFLDASLDSIKKIETIEKYFVIDTELCLIIIGQDFEDRYSISPLDKTNMASCECNNLSEIEKIKNAVNKYFEKDLER